MLQSWSVVQSRLQVSWHSPAVLVVVGVVPDAPAAPVPVMPASVPPPQPNPAVNKTANAILRKVPMFILAK